MDRVDAAVSGSTPGEFQDRLLAEMRIALNWSLDERAPHDGETEDEAAAREDRNGLLGERDEHGRRRDGLADLLEVPAINKSLLRPDGHLSQLVQSYFTETSRRDDSDEIFTREDLPVREPGILGSLARRPQLRELWQIIARQPDDALALLEEALRAALPKTLGLTSPGGDTLDALFRASRKTLRQQGQELVLVFEDLAQFGLVDGELYDQFVTAPGDDLAPLRVVFAVTDGAFNKMARTVRTRVEHEFKVGTSALAEPARFIGRYLNLARVGREATLALWKTKRGAAAPTNWMANSCDTRAEGEPCPFRDTCHTSFGTVAIDGLGEVGLYPYDAVALRRAVEHVGEDATPRAVLDQCISTNLVEADVHIERGDYPHERTRHQFDFKARMAKDALLERNPSSDPERMYRALVIWGDESPLPVGVMDAFSLDATAGPTAPTAPTEPTEERANANPATRATTQVDDLPNPLLGLFQWQNDDDLPDDDLNTFRTTLYALTQARLHLDQSLVHTHNGRGKAMLDGLFNTTSFSLEGARGRRAGGDSVRFELSRSPDDVRILAAARWFRDHGHFHPSRGTWKWPEGYDPVQLMVELETRLDGWAAEVRDRFLDVTGGGKLAQQAVGIRAVALTGMGHDPATLLTTTAVLRTPNNRIASPSKAWIDVDAIASRIAETLRADEYVGEFAAVRQGERGQPQLVDSHNLNRALTAFIADPQSSLAKTAAVSADPVLAQFAQQLLDATSAAAPAEANLVTQAWATLSDRFEDQTPIDVGRRATEIGRTARDAGLFRPTELWHSFQQAVDVLAEFGSAPSPVPGGPNLDGVLLGQHQARKIMRLTNATGVVTEAMESTRRECERSGSVAGDLSALRSTVTSQVSELAAIVASVARKE